MDMDTKKSGFDFASLDTVKFSDEGTAMEVRHFDTAEVLLDSDEKPVTITVSGPDSAAIKAYEREFINRRLKEDTKATSKNADVDALNKEKIELLVAATISWSGIQLDGSVLSFSKENAKLLYTRFPWLAEQVNAFVGRRANFLPA